jgi:hypothetical protein
MPSRLACTLTVLLIGLRLISAQPNPSLTQTLGQISTSVMRGESIEFLRQLTDDIGARLAGSPAYERAAQWAAAKFREAGLTNIRVEEFTMPNGWQRGSARARIVAPVARPLRVASVGWGHLRHREGFAEISFWFRRFAGSASLAVGATEESDRSH